MFCLLVLFFVQINVKPGWFLFRKQDSVCFLVHTIHSHTHTHTTPCTEEKNPAETGNTLLLNGLGLSRVCIVLADLSRLNHQPQTPFLHRALQFNHISCPLPVLGRKVRAMKEGFAMEVEGRAKWDLSEAEPRQKAWPPAPCQWKGTAARLCAAPKHYHISTHKQNLYRVLPWSLLRGKYSIQIKVITRTLAGKGEEYTKAAL